MALTAKQARQSLSRYHRRMRRRGIAPGSVAPGEPAGQGQDCRPSQELCRSLLRTLGERREQLCEVNGPQTIGPQMTFIDSCKPCPCRAVSAVAAKPLTMVTSFAVARLTRNGA